MPVANGVITGNAVLGFRALCCKQSLRFYLNTGMRTTRIATPGNMVKIASEFTGKSYKASRKGMEAAWADLEALSQVRDLDGMGDTAVVNAAVGGVAADL